MLKELERKRFLEAKQRLRNYMINHSTRQDSEEEEIRGEERQRLLNYFKHRFPTFAGIMKESMNARRVAKAMNVSLM